MESHEPWERHLTEMEMEDLVRRLEREVDENERLLRRLGFYAWGLLGMFVLFAVLALWSMGDGVGAVAVLAFAAATACFVKAIGTEGP
jgi:hypothetical protein